MWIIVDIVILAIIILSTITAYKKGLIGVAFKIVPFILSLIIAFILFIPISNFIINNTDLSENIETAIINNFSDNENEEDENDSQILVDYINEYTEEATEAGMNIVAEQIAQTTIRAGTFLILFIIAKIALMFVKALANFVAKLPILNQFNKVRWNIVWYYKGIANNLCFIGINISNFTNDKQYNNTRTN